MRAARQYPLDRRYSWSEVGGPAYRYAWMRERRYGASSWLEGSKRISIQLSPMIDFAVDGQGMKGPSHWR